MKEESLLSDTSLLPQMRFLFHDDSTFQLTLTMVLSVISLGSQGQNEKDKMRSTLKSFVESFFRCEADLYTQLRRNASHMAGLAMEDTQVDRLIQRDYYELKSSKEFSYKLLPQKSQADEEMQVDPVGNNMLSVQSNAAAERLEEGKVSPQSQAEEESKLS